MNWHKYLITGLIGVLAMQSGVATAAGATEDFYDLAGRIDKASATNFQPKYSSRLRQSINAMAIQHQENLCAQKYPGVRVQTFSLVGVMRMDGAFKSPTPLPDNAFTRCVAERMDLVTFPLPPGSGRGWPIAMQLDGTTGKVLYVAGDSQRAFPSYSQRPSARSMPWRYTPIPLVPSDLPKPCELSVWVSVAESGQVSEADAAASTCPPEVDKAVEAATGQWIYMGAPGSQKVATRDLRVSFSIEKNRVRVKL